jgi:hypothetical protein
MCTRNAPRIGATAGGIMKTRLSSLVLLVIGCVLSFRPAAADLRFSEAQILAADFYPGLLAPDSLVQRIDADLGLIRTGFPAVAGIHITCRQELPGDVCVYLYPDARTSFLAGENEALNALHAQIGTPEVSFGYDGFINLLFALPYKPDVLIDLYIHTEGVYYAGPLGGCLDSDRIDLLSDGSYLFCHAWGDDCPSGCSYHHYWIFSVVDSQAILVREYGSTAVQPSSWGQVKARFR